MSDVPYGPSQRPWSSQVPEGAAVSGPLENPETVYPQIPPSSVTDPSLPRIDYRLFEIPPEGLTGPQRANAYASLVDYLGTQHARFTGFQANEDESYSGRLSWLLDMHVNNIGDPFAQGDFTLNSKFCERAVLDTFAALWNADWPNRYDAEAGEGGTPVRKYPERYWGYVLTMGCTEANYYGLFNARDYLKGRQLIEEPSNGARSRGLVYVDPIDGDENPNKYRPVIFYSEDTHYSVIKAVRVLELTTFYEEGQRRYPNQCPITPDGQWPQEVPSHNANDAPDSGTVRVDQLEKLVRFFVERGHPPIIVANMGTTWKGAYDDVPAINAMLERLGQELPWLWERQVRWSPDHTDVRRGFWLHVDGALGAPFLPFIEMAHNRGLIDRRGPIFDFRNPAVMSIGCSMHKWIGGPWPSGIYMTRTKYQLEPPETVGYIGSPDTTFGGSRSGFSPLILWDYFSRMSYEDNMRKALETESVAAYAESRLRELEAELKAKFGPEVDLWIARSALSLTVRFRQTNSTLNYKWTIDTETLDVPVSDTESEQRAFAHVFVMHSLTRERVDELIADIALAAKDGWHDAFPAVIDGQPNPSPVPPAPPRLEAATQHRVFVPTRGRGWS
ncbi:MAG TPA: pyridoxal-dependent decarboxylase [Thermoanaerobaculia bacterium]|nr:pyridoxal-dependent decarboxylase [Thermoanaerobaculia bacterium]